MAVGGSAASAVTPVSSGDPALDAERILLQMDVSPGFVPEVVRQLSTPSFTLYGDGTAIYRPQGGTFDAPPPLQQAQLSEAQIEALIGFALGAGGIAAADAVYDDMFVTDQPTTIFLLDAYGVDKTVSVYALGFPPLEPGPNDADLARLTRLGATLSDFDAWVAAGGATAEGDYQPTEYLATIAPVSPDDTSTAAEWPVGEVTLITPAELSNALVVLTPEQVAQVTDVPTGGFSAIYETPDGGRVSVTIRPMLPGEEIPQS
jgi:hypothetical protein